jgi:uncharacterized membrane protein
LNTITVWEFDGPQGAAAAVPRLVQLAGEQRIQVDDAALVSWPQGQRKPSAEPLGSLTGPGALWGGFWGLLLGLIFLVPLAGPTFGAGAGALGGAMSDFGVDDDFVKSVRDVVTEGRSAIFLVTGQSTADDLVALMDDLGPWLVRCDVPPQNEDWLREALAEESRMPILPPGAARAGSPPVTPNKGGSR